MNHASYNYVRTFRQRHSLSEDELAFLITQQSPSAVSKFETGRRLPNLYTALALQILFRQEPRQLFPGLYEMVLDELMRRVKELLDRLVGDDPRTVAKREFLERVPGHVDNEREQ